ncbi:insulin-like growth factor-binding protein complex acid labile subunit [Drosophila kikkawai]|uniref:Insulin-like growth factor-binding protein complex acid labile subunit n=1 Tax=Drosophila kikkawai TaxID=30033 RepID=A0A6P4IKA9_DROKI|nr:insulin-like growth factor-binding protein complex acid labile subunit [Drosophila kikkawai]
MYRLLVSLLLLFRVECLQLSNCNHTEVTLLRDTELLTTLTLRNCSLSHLENAFFVRFGHLLQMELQYSGLNDLEDFSLNGLARLQSLSLSHNNLSTLRSWSSEPLGALTSLDLSYNAFRRLRSQGFALFPQLQLLDLSSNQISEIDEETFHGLSHLKHLHLNGNLLQRIDGSSFQGLHRLASLSLQHNLIERIELDSFETNTHLRSLRLDQNLLTSLPFLSQRGLARLVHLNLSNNQVKSLEPLGFSKNFELQSLDLSYNKLINLTKEALSGLDSLERLNISHNSVESVHTDSLETLVSLLQIDVSYNQLSTLPETFFNANTQLEEIMFGHNLIGQLPPLALAHQSHLRLIQFTGNALTDVDFLQRLPASLNRLSLHVDLSSNRLRSIDLASLRQFRYLNLADNSFNCGWLIENLVRELPTSVNFARPWSVLNGWNDDFKNIKGVDCTEGDTNRSIILLNAAEVSQYKTSKCECAQTYDEANPSPPPLTWPKIPTDRFDSRSVIIWMLAAIALAFAGLRWLRRFVDRNEGRKGGMKALNNMYVDKGEWQPQRNNNEIHSPP